MFSMAQKPWTPAAELSVRALQNASQTYGSMDKEVKVKKQKSNIFGDILPVLGMAAGAALGGPLGMTAAQGAMIGSGLGGMAGAAMGGQNAAQIGGMGVQGASLYSDMKTNDGIMKKLDGGGDGGGGSSVPSMDESLVSLTQDPWMDGFTKRRW